MARGIAEQTIQWGVEATSGTPVAASKRLPSLSVNFRAEALREKFRSMGYKSTTASVPNGFWSTGTYQMPMDFNQLIYPGSGLVGPNGGAPTGAGAAKTWLFNANATGPEANRKTFTVEKGDSVAGEQYVQTQFRSMVWSVSRTRGVNINGNLFSRFPANVSMTGSPADVAQRVIPGILWDIFIDTSYPGIASDFTTQVPEAYAASFNLGDKFNPVWYLNSATNSFGDVVDVAHDITAQMSMHHNAQSRAFFADLADNGGFYMRFQATGPDEIEAGIFERVRLDMAFNFETPNDDDYDGLYGKAYDLGSVYDSTLGGHWKMQVRNRLTAL